MKSKCVRNCLLIVNSWSSFRSKDDEDDEDDLWNENDDWWNCRDDNSESIQREMIISRNYAGVIIGMSFSL